MTAQAAPDPSCRYPVAVEGILYALNLHTGRYVIQDDAGMSVSIRARRLSAAQAADLLGQRVAVRGTGRFDASGKVKDIEAESIGPAAEIEGFDSGAFERDVELEELLQGATPIDSVEELVIDGLTADEIDSFVRNLGK